MLAEILILLKQNWIEFFHVSDFFSVQINRYFSMDSSELDSINNNTFKIDLYIGSDGVNWPLITDNFNFERVWT